MKKVLIITYYWPPAGGVAVQRVAKFCKYLPKSGWEPVILTVRNGNYANLDPGLFSEIAHIKRVYPALSLEPHLIFNFVKRLVRSREKKSHDHRVSNSVPHYYSWFMAELIRLNLFIPDTRIGWYFQACHTARRIMAENKIDLVFSTSPPYTVQLIGLYIKKTFHLPWIADFRDPWIENTRYNTVPRLKIIKWINRYLEQMVLNHVDATITVGETLKNLLKTKRNDLPVKVITNGYDESNRKDLSIQKTSYFYLSYMGFMDPNQVPLSLFKALRRMIDLDEEFSHDFRFRIIGDISVNANHALNRYFDSSHLIKIPHLPYLEFLHYLYEEQILLVIIDQVPNNRLIITGKLFEYLPTGNPILGIGPEDGDAAQILNQTGAGKIIEYDNEKGMRRFIAEHYQLWKNNRLNTGIKQYVSYTRNKLTEALAAYFNEFVH